MSLTSFILKFAAPEPKVDSFGRYLFVGPHPDDIEIGAGGAVAALTAAGKDVHFLVCMDGRFGLEHAPEGTTPEELASIRKEESLKGAAKLGVTNVHFLSLTDGGMYDPKDLLSGMAKVIGEVRPDVIFAPDPCVTSECHVDHLRTGEAARQLAFFAPFPEIMARYGAKSAPVKAIAFFMTAKPNRFIRTAGLLEKQIDAILCHKSQFPDRNSLEQIVLYLKLRGISFGLRTFKGRAEGFRVLDQTHMHCLPEAEL